MAKPDAKTKSKTKTKPNTEECRWSRLDSDSKLPLRLSAYAWRVLDNDRSCFYPMEKRVSNNRLVTDILNNFYNYTSDSYTVESSIDFACKNYCGKLEQSARRAARAEMEERLIRKARQRMSRVPKKRPNSTSQADIPLDKIPYMNATSSILKFISVDKTERDVGKYTFVTDESKVMLPRKNDTPVYKDFPTYLCILLEEYAELPYTLRERVFFRQTCEAIEAGINQYHGQCLINLQMQDGHQYQIIPYSFSPYGLKTDPDTTYPSPILSDALLPYNYLVGFICEGTDAFSVLFPASFRLSAIKPDSITVLPNKTSAKQLRRYEAVLNKATQLVGVPYLSPAYIESNVFNFILMTSASPITVVALFTLQGVLTLHQSPIDRPHCELVDAHADGCETWKFSGPKWQLERYLFAFGTDVHILKAPEDFTDALAARHLQAAMQVNPTISQFINTAFKTIQDDPRSSGLRQHISHLTRLQLKSIPRDGDPSGEDDARLKCLDSAYNDPLYRCWYPDLKDDVWHPNVKVLLFISDFADRMYLSYSEARELFRKVTATDYILNEETCTQEEFEAYYQFHWYMENETPHPAD